MHNAKLTLRQVETALGFSGDGRIGELGRAIAGADAASILKLLDSAFNNGLDLKQLNRELMNYLRNLLMIKAGSDDLVHAEENIDELKALLEKTPLERLIKTLKGLAQAQNQDLSTTLPIEIAVLDVISQPATIAAVPVQAATKTAPTASPPWAEPRPVTPEARPVAAPATSATAKSCFKSNSSNSSKWHIDACKAARW